MLGRLERLNINELLRVLRLQLLHASRALATHGKELVGMLLNDEAHPRSVHNRRCLECLAHRGCNLIVDADQIALRLVERASGRFVFGHRATDLLLQCGHLEERLVAIVLRLDDFCGKVDLLKGELRHRLVRALLLLLHCRLHRPGALLYRIQLAGGAFDLGAPTPLAMGAMRTEDRLVAAAHLRVDAESDSVYAQRRSAAAANDRVQRMGVDANKALDDLLTSDHCLAQTHYMLLHNSIVLNVRRQLMKCLARVHELHVNIAERADRDGRGGRLKAIGGRMAQDESATALYELDDRLLHSRSRLPAQTLAKVLQARPAPLMLRKKSLVKVKGGRVVCETMRPVCKDSRHADE